MQALNFTTAAIDQFIGFQKSGTPLAQVAFRYLIEKLRQAQVFVLQDGGELLDRSKPTPEVPGLTFKPPFPVVALEYLALKQPGQDIYETVPCPKRIALAWEWQNDAPAALRQWWPDYGPGVVIASIAFNGGHWFPVAMAAHYGFDETWQEPQERTSAMARLVADLVNSGRVSKQVANARCYPSSMVALLPDACVGIALTAGRERALEMLRLDIMDEVGAYMDLCYALACRNVTAERCGIDDAVNRRRIRDGKKPLKDFHILKLSAADGNGNGFGSSSGARRSHLRRGHIRHLRHLGPDRITWVNAAMVRGRQQGFADKAYAVGARS